MRVLMTTNTYLPNVSGVANAVDRMARALRKLGHEVLVVAPGNDPFGTVHVDPQDEHVIRVPALTTEGSDALPFATNQQVADIASRFQPEIVHTHQPFMLGEIGLRAARHVGVPVVLTHHTLYEHHAHRVTGTLPAAIGVAGAIASYAAGATIPVVYANRCAAVLAPTESVATLLRERGVTTPVYVTPSGIDLERFETIDRIALRKRYALSMTAPLVGHVGRLSKEKGLKFLADAMARFMATTEARAVVVGKGPCVPDMERIFRKYRVASRVRYTGVLKGQALANAFGAMDVFVFASTSETQGLVLAEAMAAGTPVIGLDGPGTRDIVEDRYNGLIVNKFDPAAFADALMMWAQLSAADKAKMRRNARETGLSYGLESTTAKLVAAYRDVLARTA